MTTNKTASDAEIKAAFLALLQGVACTLNAIHDGDPMMCSPRVGCCIGDLEQIMKAVHKTGVLPSLYAEFLQWCEGQSQRDNGDEVLRLARRFCET
jgi:hypothetical protein